MRLNTKPRFLLKRKIIIKREFFEYFTFYVIGEEYCNIYFSFPRNSLDFQKPLLDTPYNMGYNIVMENMTRTFIETEIFTKKWNKLGFTDDDLAILENQLMKNPDIAPIMEGTGGLRKYRFAMGNKGKSGGARVCYVDFVFNETIYLIDVFSKSEKINLSNEEKNILKDLIKSLKGELKK